MDLFPLYFHEPAISLIELHTYNRGTELSTEYSGCIFVIRNVFFSRNIFRCYSTVVALLWTLLIKSSRLNAVRLPNKIRPIIAQYNIRISAGSIRGPVLFVSWLANNLHNTVYLSGNAGLLYYTTENIAAPIHWRDARSCPLATPMENVFIMRTCVGISLRNV